MLLSRPPCIIISTATVGDHYIDRFHCISQIWFTLLSPCNFPYRRSQSSDQSFSTNVSGPSPPPQLPDHKKAPAIKVQSSTFSSDRAKTINNPSHSDVVLRLEGKTYHAHRYVLASASDLFRLLLRVTQEVKVRFSISSYVSRQMLWIPHIYDGHSWADQQWL